MPCQSGLTNPESYYAVFCLPSHGSVCISCRCRTDKDRCAQSCSCWRSALGCFARLHRCNLGEESLKLGKACFVVEQSIAIPGQAASDFSGERFVSCKAQRQVDVAFRVVGHAFIQLQQPAPRASKAPTHELSWQGDDRNSGGKSVQAG